MAKSIHGVDLLEVQPNYENRILVFVKRGDPSGDYGPRHMEIIAYIDPLVYTPEISVLMSQAYLCVTVPRSYLPTIQNVIAGNTTYKEVLSRRRNVLNYTKLPVAIQSRLTSKDSITIRDFTSIPAQFIQDQDLGTANVPDLASIAQGSASYGSGGTYALRSTAFADIAASLTGNLTLTQVSEITDTAQARIGTNIGTYTLIDDGASYLTNASVDLNYYYVNMSGGTGLVEIKNHYLKRDATVLTTSRILFREVHDSSAAEVRIHHNKFDCNSQTNALGVSLNTNTGTPKFYRNIIANATTASTGYGLMVAGSATMAIGNNTIHNCTGAIQNSSKVQAYRNIALVGNAANWLGSITNSTSVNCGTDKAAVGAATDTNPQINAVVASEFVSTDISNADAFKCKRGAKFATNGTTSTIAENTTGFRGNAAPGLDSVYSIGADEAGVIVVSLPNGGNTWRHHDNASITWQSENCGANVKIELTRNGTDYETLAASTSNDGAYTYEVLGDTTEQAKIRITCTTYTSISDVSDAVFTIAKMQLLTGSTYTITRTINDVDAVNIYISRDSGSTWSLIAANVPISHSRVGNDEIYQDLSYSWKVKRPFSSHCKFKITDASDETVYDISDAEFEIVKGDTLPNISSMSLGCNLKL